MIWDVWHTQLRVVHQHFPDAKLRAIKTGPVAGGNVFVYVTPTVARREVVVPPSVVSTFKELGYIIIHIQEPRE